MIKFDQAKISIGNAVFGKSLINSDTFVLVGITGMTVDAAGHDCTGLMTCGIDTPTACLIRQVFDQGNFDSSIG